MTHEARELEMYIINTECHINPITQCLVDAMEGGSYTHDWAMAYMIRRVCEPAKDYDRTYGTIGTPWQDIFTKKDRIQCAESLLERIRGSWRHEHDKV